MSLSQAEQGLHFPPGTTDQLIKLCQVAKQPVDELGERTPHCLPFQALPQRFALARLPLARQVSAKV